MTSIKEAKITNSIKSILLFLVLFSFSTLNVIKTTINSNDTIDYDKIFSGDLNVLKDDFFFKSLSSKIEDEKNAIIQKKKP